MSSTIANRSLFLSPYLAGIDEFAFHVMLVIYDPQGATIYMHIKHIHENGYAAPITWVNQALVATQLCQYKNTPVCRRDYCQLIKRGNALRITEEINTP